MVFRRNEQGSMVVEASLILPIFLSLLLFLITLIRISTVEIALNHGVSEATKQVAAHMYPVALGLDRFSEGEAADQLAAYSNFFTEEISQLLHIRQDMEDGVVADYDRILSRIFQPYVDLFIDDRMVYLEHLQVTKVTLPFGRDAAYFGLEVRYDMPLHIPFINKQIVFKHQAYERVWVGDAKTTAPVSKSSSSEGDQEESENDQEEEKDQEEEIDHKLVIESITSPIQRGASKKERGSIIARGPPNQSATIEIYYASKFEKKMQCSFNSEGWFKCDITIGGNAFEGIYEVVVKVKGQEARRSFEVLSKENMDKYKNDRKRS